MENLAIPSVLCLQRLSSPLCAYFTSSRFLCMDVFVGGINHYRFFLEAKQGIYSYRRLCHITMSRILYQSAIIGTLVLLLIHF